MTTTHNAPRSAGEIALVTGGNKGIGKEIARRLAELEMTVYIGARDRERGDEAAAELSADGADVRVVQLDVTDAQSVTDAAGRLKRECGRLDALVNNAAITSRPHRPPSETLLEEVRNVYDTNVFGVILVTQTMLPLLRRAPRARIVNVSSEIASLNQASDPHTYVSTAPLLLPYTSSKAALNAVTILFAKELEDAGIVVNAVSPPYVPTDLNDHTPMPGAVSAVEGARVPALMATRAVEVTATFVADRNGVADGETVPW